eukprot:m.375820 g.375820  ORF g.375820 m.375820 type:complete len:69 (+) comp78875_c0_seq1:1-207(+)
MEVSNNGLFYIQVITVVYSIWLEETLGVHVNPSNLQWPIAVSLGVSLSMNACMLALNCILSSDSNNCL